LESPYELESLGGGVEEEDEHEEKGDVTPLPHSLPPEDLPFLSDLFSQQVGISIGPCEAKWPQTGTRASSGPPPQSGLALVSFDLQGVSVALVVTGIAYLLRVL
jgi:hypothetical protein